MPEVHDLAAPYVMNALDTSEREEYETHLDGCDLCQAEVARLEEGALALADSSASKPPPELKARIMETITLSATDGGVIESTRMRWRWDWAFAAAAVVAVVFAGLFVIVSNQLDESERLAAVLGAEDAVTIEFDSSVGSAAFVYSENLGRGVFVERTLREPSGDRVYELWLVDEAGPAPAGLFRPASQQTVLVEGIQRGLVFAMTEEPAGGSDQPTGEILLSAEL